MKKLLCLFSFYFVVIISVKAYAANENWGWYNFDGDGNLIVRPESAKSGNRKIPNGDCLEMMCQYGCVENEAGYGYCCPAAGNTGDACKVDDEDVGPCCLSGRCENGECKPSTCTFNNKTYKDGASVPDANGCGVCRNGVVAPKENVDCRTCNTTSWKWQNENEKSIGQCGKCQNGKVVVDFKKLDECHDCNTEWEIQVKEGFSTKIYTVGGEEKCCENGTKYKKEDGTEDCCPESHILADISDSTSKACCPSVTPVWDAKLGKCAGCPKEKLWDEEKKECVCPKNQTPNASGVCYCDPEIYEKEPQEDGTCICKTEESTELSLNSYAPNGNRNCRITLANFGKLKGKYYFKYISGGHYYICGAAYPKYEMHIHSNGTPYPSSGEKSLIFDFASPPGQDPNFISRAKKSKKYFIFDGKGEISLVFYDDTCSDNCGKMQLELRKVSDKCED